MAASIYYDGECPFCARYVTLLRLKKTIGPVELIDLRLDEGIKLELSSQGFNLDKGMVVDIDGRRFGGADAVNQLALLSTPSNFFNKFNKWIMSIPFLACYFSWDVNKSPLMMKALGRVPVYLVPCSRYFQCSIFLIIYWNTIAYRLKGICFLLSSVLCCYLFGHNPRGYYGF